MRALEGKGHRMIWRLTAVGPLSAAFVKYGNKTDRPPVPVYTTLCGAYVSDGFNERSISAAFVKCDNKRVGGSGGDLWEADPRPRL